MSNTLDLVTNGEREGSSISRAAGFFGSIIGALVSKGQGGQLEAARIKFEYDTNPALSML